MAVLDNIDDVVVTPELYDAWKVKPPCQIIKENGHGACHPQCPYNYDCWGDYMEDDEDE